MRKYLSIILVALITLLSSVSCSKEEKFDYSMDTLCGTWQGTDVKVNGQWKDITSDIYESFHFSITFHSDGTYYGKGYFGTGSGTYKAFGKTIETYVGGELFYTYHVNSMNGRTAELTMSSKGSSIEIRVKKQ